MNLDTHNLSSCEWSPHEVLRKLKGQTVLCHTTFGLQSLYFYLIEGQPFGDALCTIYDGIGNKSSAYVRCQTTNNAAPQDQNYIQPLYQYVDSGFYMSSKDKTVSYLVTRLYRGKTFGLGVSSAQHYIRAFTKGHNASEQVTDAQVMFLNILDRNVSHLTQASLTMGCGPLTVYLHLEGGILHYKGKKIGVQKKSDEMAVDSKYLWYAQNELKDICKVASL